MSDEIKREEGPKREFSTGAESQNATGKGTPVLVPGDAIIDIAKHFENGAAVYGARNWEKGIPLSEQLNSLERHLQQEKMGMTDEPHARALAWRAVCYLATKLRIENGLLPAELDDMPEYTSTLTMAKVAAKGPVEVFEERLDKEEIGVTDEVAEEFKDTVVSQAKDDGMWYCNASWSCLTRGFSNIEPNLFVCDKHMQEWRKDHGK